MVRSSKRFVAGGTLALYAGMMLFGQSLHELMGCEHAHSHCVVLHASTTGETSTRAAGVVNALDCDHDPESCPLCQFHAQGQLAPSVTGGELRQSVTTAALVHVPLVFEVRAPGVHGPRPPPCV